MCTMLFIEWGFQLLHNKLQAEKTRLAHAVQNCEAAIACVSRPGSPTGTLHPPVFDKEITVRLRLEDNIDQVCLWEFVLVSRIFLERSSGVFILFYFFTEW